MSHLLAADGTKKDDIIAATFYDHIIRAISCQEKRRPCSLSEGN